MLPAIPELQQQAQVIHPRERPSVKKSNFFAASTDIFSTLSAAVRNSVMRQLLSMASAISVTRHRLSSSSKQFATQDVSPGCAR